MNWTTRDLNEHPNRDKLLSKSVKEETSTNSSNETTGKLTFTAIADPVGKPRMTRSDKWRKRPAVLRYRTFCDQLREATPRKVFCLDVYAIEVKAFIAMPASWSKRKKQAHAGTSHRSKPDWDNIAKAVCDALFEEDCAISDGLTRKRWCYESEQRLEITVWFNTEKTGS